MPDMLLDVDVAVVVPVNISSLLDDTDTKLRETSITYDQAGMDLVWNFVTSAGVQTQTAVTPTTGDDHDWGNKGGGMYSIEIPASGGDVNNDTEGYGWFTGICTGVLPWRGPTICFRAAALNDDLCDAGAALAKESQLSGIANVGAATNEHAIAAPDGFVLDTGTGETNDEDDTHAKGGLVHSFSDNAGTMAARYRFNNFGAFVPVALTIHGRLNGSNDDLTVQVNLGTYAVPNWVDRGVINGNNLSVNVDHSVLLYIADVMTGTEAGKFEIRLYGTGLTSATMYVDQITAQKTSKADNTGYDGRAISFDDTAANTNTVPDVDGTARNPVSTWAAVKTLLASTGLSRVEVANGSTVALDANSDGLTLLGKEWTLTLGGRSIEGLFAEGAQVTGIGTGAGTPPRFEKCGIGAVTLPPSIIRWCGIGAGSGQFTAGSAGQFYFVDCVSMVPGSGTPVFVFAGLGSATGINVRKWGGGGTWTFDSNCTPTIEVVAGGGHSITTGGADVEIRGTIRSLTVLMSAAEEVRFVGITGPISLSGTTTGTVKLYGVSSSLVDTTVEADVQDETVSRANVAFTTCDEVLSGSTHNVANSLGRRIRALQEYEGYSNGFIYIDTVNGVAGTDPQESGTIGNPVDSLADAITLSGLTKHKKFYLYPGSSIALEQDMSGYVFDGVAWSLAMAAYDLSSCYVFNAYVTGIGTSDSLNAQFVGCLLHSTSIGSAVLIECGIHTSLTLTEVGGKYTLVRCYEATGSSPYLDLAADGITLQMDAWFGAIEVRGMMATDVGAIYGTGHVTIHSGCTGGALTLGGNMSRTDNAADAVSLSEDARMDLDQITAGVTADDAVTLSRKLLQNRKEFDLDNSKMYIWNDGGSAREYEADLTDEDGAAVTATTQGPINTSRWAVV